MSYADFLSSLDTALVAAGLTAAPDQKSESLAQAGRGNFDGSYLIVNESGAEPWPELSTNPSHWRASMRLEVATELTTSAIEQSKTVESRARAVFENVIYATTPVGRCIYEWSNPILQRTGQDKRQVWILRFKARWTE